MDSEVTSMDDAQEWVRIRKVIDDISFPGYSIGLGQIALGQFFIRVVYDEPDVMTGVVERQEGRAWMFPAGQTTGQIVQTCFKAIHASLEHRAREHFLFRGKQVMQPHLDLEKLAELLPAVPGNGEPIFK